MKAADLRAKTPDQLKDSCLLRRGRSTRFNRQAASSGTRRGCASARTSRIKTILRAQRAQVAQQVGYMPRRVLQGVVVSNKADKI